MIREGVKRCFKDESRLNFSGSLFPGFIGTFSQTRSNLLAWKIVLAV
ncbi:MAG: hypothetical protein J0I79_19140 [Mesorhizobium sp.]|nr:hypothetical protein [Mesorhizobium sp.]